MRCNTSVAPLFNGFIQHSRGLHSTYLTYYVLWLHSKQDWANYWALWNADTRNVILPRCNLFQDKLHNRINMTSSPVSDSQLWKLNRRFEWLVFPEFDWPIVFYIYLDPYLQSLIRGCTMAYLRLSGINTCLEGLIHYTLEWLELAHVHFSLQEMLAWVKTILVEFDLLIRHLTSVIESGLKFSNDAGNVVPQL